MQTTMVEVVVDMIIMEVVETVAGILCSIIAQPRTITAIGGTVVPVETCRTSNSRISNGHHTTLNRAMVAIIQVFDPRQLMAVKHTTRLPVGVHLVEEVLRTNITLIVLGVMGRPMGALVEIMADMGVMVVVKGIRGEAVTVALVVMVATEGKLPLVTAPVVDHITPVAGAEADINYSLLLDHVNYMYHCKRPCSSIIRILVAAKSPRTLPPAALIISPSYQLFLTWHWRYQFVL
jgi:hypothetical protein